MAGLGGLVQGALAEPAPVAAPPHTMVSPAEQAARNAERVHILDAELAKEQQHADAAARQKAQRLIAGDAVAAEEAEQSRLRSLENVAALRRELATTLVPSAPVRSAGASGPVQPARHVADGAVSWWDVYSHDPARPRPEPRRQTVQFQTVKTSPARP